MTSRPSRPPPCSPGARTRPHAFRVDPSLARGLSYYTGAIMEIAVPDLAGSLGGGGRYDNLVGMFLGQSIPACGFSLGLERILVVMGERGMFPADVEAASVDVVVAALDEAAQTAAMQAAAELRRGQDLRVDLYPDVASKMDASSSTPIIGTPVHRDHLVATRLRDGTVHDPERGGKTTDDNDAVGDAASCHSAGIGRTRDRA